MSDSIENIKIESFEQAKAYFIAMGCSSFHIAREDFERRDEYYSLQISKETERKWAHEHISERYALFMVQGIEGKAWVAISRFIDLIELYPTGSHIKMLCDVVTKYGDDLPALDKLIIAESLVGRGLEPSGVILDALELRMNYEAKTLAIWAKEMALDVVKQDETLKERGVRVFEELEAIIDVRKRISLKFRQFINFLFFKDN